MNELSAYNKFYFLGIGGIGMSALARYFKAHGFEVAGFDRTSSDITKEMEEAGIQIHYEDDVELIPQEYKTGSQTLVIITPAVHKENKEWEFFRNLDSPILKRAQVLAILTHQKTTIAVAGTHGKTSTCAFIAHILKTANVPFFGFLGGISVNYNTNYFQPENDAADLIVVEADEFDRSFLQLNPDISIITSVDSDHLDIYGTPEELRAAYLQFAQQNNSKGKLLLNENVIFNEPLPAKVYHYGLDSKSEIFAENIRIENGAFVFDANLVGTIIKDIIMGVPGLHNIENALAAMEAVKDFVSDTNIMVEAMQSFRGVHRRFEVIINKDECVFIDDYAHHPTEIKATLDTVRKLYPHKKILGIFQPHLFSRTRDFASDFAESLSALDELILLPIYPARELPIDGVTSAIILDKVKFKRKSIKEKGDIASAIENTDAEVIITIGAGDIDRLVEPLKQVLLKRIKG